MVTTHFSVGYRHIVTGTIALAVDYPLLLPRFVLLNEMFAFVRQSATIIPHSGFYLHLRTQVLRLRALVRRTLGGYRMRSGRSR